MTLPVTVDTSFFLFQVWDWNENNLLIFGGIGGARYDHVVSWMYMYIFRVAKGRGGVEGAILVACSLVFIVAFKKQASKF